MNSDWTELPLGELVTHKKGFAFKSQDFSKDGGRRVIRVSDTNATSIKTDDPVYLSEQKAQNYPDYELSHGDIILTTVGSRPPLYDSMVGKTIRVPKEIEGALLNQNMVKLSPKNGLVDPGFLYSVLKTKRFISHIEGSARGNANQASITLEDTFEFPVLVPSLQEQRKIAEILSCWDKGIDILDRQSAQLESYKTWLIKRLIDQPEVEGIEIKSAKYSDVAEINSETLGESTPTDFQFHYVDLSSVQAGQIRYPSDRINFLGSPSRARRVVRDGDILMATVRPNLRGFAVVKAKCQPIICSTGFAVIRSKQSQDNQYLYQALYSAGVTKQINSLIVGSNYPAINASDVASLEIKYPVDSKIRLSIGSLLSVVDSELFLVGSKITLLRRQKQALMQKLLTGKIRVKV